MMKHSIMRDTGKIIRIDWMRKTCLANLVEEYHILTLFSMGPGISYNNLMSKLFGKVYYDSLIFRFLKKLVQKGYLERTEKTYRLTLEGNKRRLNILAGVSKTRFKQHTEGLMAEGCISISNMAFVREQMLLLKVCDEITEWDEPEFDDSMDKREEAR